MTSSSDNDKMYLISGEQLEELEWAAKCTRERPYNPDDQLVWMTPEEEEKRIRQDERKKIEQEKAAEKYSCDLPPSECLLKMHQGIHLAKIAAINGERTQTLNKLNRIRFMVKHAWEGERDTNPPDLGRILRFVEGFIAELRQQTGEQTRGEQQRGQRE